MTREELEGLAEGIIETLRGTAPDVRFVVLLAHPDHVEGVIVANVTKGLVVKRLRVAAELIESDMNRRTHS